MSTTSRLLTVQHPGDTFLPEADLWLDPHRPRPLAFVSHGHADHFANHGKIITSVGTQKIIEARYKAKKVEFLGLEFGEIHDLGNGFEIKMLPAGHIAGSAMLHIRRQEDGVSLLHTGDFKLRPGLAAEECRTEHADTLIMETTFGLPKYRMPPSEEVWNRMAQFAIRTLEEGSTPIFLAYSLGKAQEVLMALHKLRPDLRFRVHETVSNMNGVVAELGFAIPPCELFAAEETFPDDCVLVVPPNVVRNDAIQKQRKRTRIAMVTGWGVDSGAKYRYRADEVFPLTDHADYDDLIRFVELVDPSLVLTIHGSVDEFARDLRVRGFKARALEAGPQMELELDDSTGLAQRLHPVESDSPLSKTEFGKFALMCRKIDLAIEEAEKAGILSDYLGELKPESARQIASWFSPDPSQNPVPGLDWAVIRRSLLEVSGLSPGEYRHICSSKADAARTAPLVLSGKTTSTAHDIRGIHDFFLLLGNARGTTAQIDLLNQMLRNLHPSEGAVVIAFLTGASGIGFTGKLLDTVTQK